VAIIAALPKSELFGQIEDALEAGDREALNTAIRLARDYARAIQRGQRGEQSALMQEEQAAKIAISAPDYADVRYLGRTLISNIFPTKAIDFVRFFLPYAGGTLSASDFQVTHFLRQVDSEPFEVLIVAHHPQLSAEQRALIRRIPIESREMLIGGGDLMIGTPAALFATVTAAVVGAGVGYAIGRALQHVMAEQFVELERSELARNAADFSKLVDLPPIATVQALIDAKRATLANI
jgi:hypothetical protein